MLLICIAGRAGVGKDTFADAVCDEFGDEVYRTSFAEPIREFVYGLTGTTPAEKEQQWRYGKSPRQMMQTLGTEWGRHCVSSDLWVDLAIDRCRASGKRVCLITDGRFRNECQAVRDMGGKVVLIDRPDARQVSHHVSEQADLLPLADVVVCNNGTRGDLRFTAIEVARGIMREASIDA